MPPNGAAACGERDQLFGLGVEGRRVDERRPDAERAFFHRLANERLHARQLGGVRRAVFVAQLVHADSRRADERCDVGGDAALRDVVQVFVERRPGDVELDVPLLLAVQSLHLGIERAHRLALAEDLERHPLLDVAERAAVLDQRFVRPAQHVDEARRDGEATRIDLGLALRIGERTNRRNAVAEDRDVSYARGGSAAVVDVAAPDDDVVGVRLRGATGRGEEDGRGDDRAS